MYIYTYIYIYIYIYKLIWYKLCNDIYNWIYTNTCEYIDVIIKCM